MLKCSTCQSEQDSGQFCEVCGGHLEEAKNTEIGNTLEIDDEHVAAEAEALDTVAATVTTPQESIDYQEELSKYGLFLLKLLKDPTEGLKLSENKLLYGIINLVLFITTVSLSIYFLLNAIFKNTLGLFSNFGMFGVASNLPNSIPFGSIFLQSGVSGMILIATAAGSSFVFSKMMTSEVTFKGLLTQYGATLTPLIAVNILASIFSGFGSPGFGSTLLSISLVCAVLVLPALIVYEKGSHTGEKAHKVYFSLGTSTVSLFALYVIIKNAFANLFGNIADFLQFLNFF